MESWGSITWICTWLKLRITSVQTFKLPCKFTGVCSALWRQHSPPFLVVLNHAIAVYNVTKQLQNFLLQIFKLHLWPEKITLWLFSLMVLLPRCVDQEPSYSIASTNSAIQLDQCTFSNCQWQIFIISISFGRIEVGCLTFFSFVERCFCRVMCKNRLAQPEIRTIILMDSAGDDSSNLRQPLGLVRSAPAQWVWWRRNWSSRSLLDVK